MPRRFVAPSAVIVLVLLAQAAVTFAGAVVKWRYGTFDDHYWPFLDYPMYAEAYGPPVQTSTVRLFATLPNDRRIELDADYMGLDYFGWRYHIVERLVAKTPVGRYANRAQAVADDRHEALQRVLRQIAMHSVAPPTRLTVDRRVYTLTDGELIEIDTEQIIEIDQAMWDALRLPGKPTP